MKTKINDNRERWIVCPVCGKKIQKARITYSEIRCECGTNITVLALKDFITTLIHDNDEIIPIEQRIREYCDVFIEFTK